jgi:ribosomal protein S27AE
MLNNHGLGKRLICEQCGDNSKSFDKANNGVFIRDAMRVAGWTYTNKKDFCPRCSKKEPPKT